MVSTRKEYFVEGLEKYLHFSTGLMFATAAAVIQSAKLDNATWLQSFLELAAWIFLILAAIVGVFTSLKHSSSLTTFDEYLASISELKEAPSMMEAEVKRAEARQGFIDHGRKIQLDEYLEEYEVDQRKEIDRLLDQFKASKKSIELRNTAQVWIFVTGLIFLSFARALPIFSHRTNQSTVISISK